MSIQSRMFRNTGRGLPMRDARTVRMAAHARSNFGLGSFVDAGPGRMRPMYRMTVNGLSELAMSFTDKTTGLLG